MEEKEIILEVENDKELAIDILQEEIKEIHPIYEQLDITPSVQKQEYKGSFDKVTVAGDEDLKAENIKEGTSIFGVEGSAKIANFKITDGKELSKRIDNPNEAINFCDWEKFTSAENMFGNCKQITELNLQNANTKNVTTMYNMFQYCEKLISLDLSGLNTSSVTDMQRMFYTCRELSFLDVSNFDTSKVTDMYSMFANCYKLQNIDVSNFDTSKVTDMSSMFSGIGNKATENLSLDISNFNMEKVKNIGYFLNALSTLINLKFGRNLGKAYTQKTENYSSYKLDLSNSKNLTYESLMSVINNLYDLNLSYDVANGGTLYRQSLVLGSTNLAKLTADEIAIATNKGWNVT